MHFLQKLTSRVHSELSRYNKNCLVYVTGFGKIAIEHVFMYKLNISINMYTEVIFTTPISLHWKGA